MATQNMAHVPITAMGLDRKGRELRMAGKKLSEIANLYGTPCYVYSSEMMQQAYQKLSAIYCGAAACFLPAINLFCGKGQSKPGGDSPLCRNGGGGGYSIGRRNAPRPCGGHPCR